MDTQLNDFEELTQDELEEAARYSIVINFDPRDSIYVAEVPELRGAKTHGSTPAEAAENAVIVAALWIRSARMFNEQVPRPRALAVA
jgi:predicted RNase H-like HicB family nuclease